MADVRPNSRVWDAVLAWAPRRVVARGFQAFDFALPKLALSRVFGASWVEDQAVLDVYTTAWGQVDPQTGVSAAQVRWGLVWRCECGRAGVCVCVCVYLCVVDILGSLLF
jgi:hypothetical protein